MSPRIKNDKHVWRLVPSDKPDCPKKRTCERCGQSQYYTVTGYDRLTGKIMGWRPMLWHCVPEKVIQ